MRRKNVSFAWWGVLAGTMAASGALGLVACSGGDDDAGTDGGKDTGTKADTGTGTDGNTGMDGNMGTDGNTMMDCGTIPTFPTPEAGPYCPFQAGGDGGIFASCATNEHCCEYTADSGLPSTCSASQVMCVNSPGAIDWQCDEQGDCTGMTCCIQGNVISKDKFCFGQAFVTGVTGSKCQASCTKTDAGGEAPMCSKSSDCPNGTTCHTFKKSGKNLGVCL